jgi:hypothetical protein
MEVATITVLYHFRLKNELLFSKIVIEHICNTLTIIEVQTSYLAVQHLY